MHRALGHLRDPDLSGLRITRRITQRVIVMSVDPGMDPDELEIRAESIVQAIGCLRDRLKDWCRQRQRPDEVDTLINQDRNMALMHDIWNHIKHGPLNRPPRSGCVPRLLNLRRSIGLSVSGPGYHEVLFPFHGGVVSRGNGEATLAITGDVVDEKGTHLAEFSELCFLAVAGWEHALRRAGAHVLEN